jgi:serine protease Do
MLLFPLPMRWRATALVAALALFGCHRDAATPPVASGDAGSPPRSAPPSFTPATGSPIAPADISLLEQINRENIRVIASALPSIVRISATMAVDPRAEMSGNFTRLPFPFERHDATPVSEVAYGSGVVLKKDGYIVTNSHVVENAQPIEVQLQDHRVFPATVVQANPRLDVAVLKIAATDLKPLPWGDSDKVRVGEQVFAIGNPFDLGDSASRGIISATGRAIPEPSASFEDYLQTDAAINPGNSGGALINIHGELIGINVEIASTTGADRGVGFALPSNLLRYAVSSLLENGHSPGGFLGVALPTVVDEGVIAQLGLGSGEGALLAGVYPSSPAARARLQPADFITEIDGHKIGSISELQVIAPQLPVGRQAEVTYIRDGEPHTTSIKIGRGPEGAPHFASAIIPETSESAGPLVPAGTAPNALSGLQVASLNAKLRARWQVDDWISGGAVITGVQDSSVVETRGLQQGDVIELVCTRRAAPEELSSASELSHIAAQLRPDQGVALLVHRRDSTRFVYLPPLQ